VSPAIEPGIYHIGNAGIASWYDVALEIAGHQNKPSIIEACRSADYPTRAPRPRRAVLALPESPSPPRAWQGALVEALRTGAY
jgi:dTDP-4-dehydrorhamnose reductase